MGKKLCYGCMNMVEEGEPCQCGFDGQEYHAPAHHLAPGSILHDRYQIGKSIGEGGFGITYVGRDTLLGMKVAIKEFYMKSINTRDVNTTVDVAVVKNESRTIFDSNREKFLDEARVLAQFADEDGIVGIRDYFRANSTAYIVMDFLEGETLKTKLKRELRISWKTVFHLLKPVIDSLIVVHEHHIIHRDISPDNIMCLKNGKVQLLDFGAARNIRNKDIHSLSLILKPGFAPEEQYHAKGELGDWTDIYALCATMYNCITGIIPQESIERGFRDQVVPPHELVPDCSIAVSNVIMKGMSLKAEARFRTVKELRSYMQMAEKWPDDASICAEMGETQENGQRTTVPQDGSETTFASVDNILINETSGAISDDSVTAFAKEITDENATTFAGEAKNNETTYAGEADSHATVFAGEIDKNVATVANENDHINEGEHLPEKEHSSTVAKNEKNTETKTHTSESNNTTERTRRIAISSISLLLLAGFLIFLISQEMQKSTETSSTVVSSPTPTVTASFAEAFSEIKINGETIKLPISYEEITNAGFDATDLEELEEILDPDETSKYIEFVNQEDLTSTIEVEFWNPSIQEEELKNCYIRLIRLKTNDSSEDTEQDEITVGNLPIGDLSEDTFKTYYNGVYERIAPHYYQIELDQAGYLFTFEDGELSEFTVYTSIADDNKILPEGYEIPEYIQKIPSVSQEIIDSLNLQGNIQWTYQTEDEVKEDVTYLKDILKPTTSLLIETDDKTYTFETTMLIQDLIEQGVDINDAPIYLDAGDTVEALIVSGEGLPAIEIVVANPYDTSAGFAICMIEQITVVAEKSELSDDSENKITEEQEKSVNIEIISVEDAESFVNIVEAQIVENDSGQQLILDNRDFLERVFNISSN